MQLNEAVRTLPGTAATVAKRVEDFRRNFPSETLIHLDRTGMTAALPDGVTEGLMEAVRDMATPFGTHLDSPAYGYPGPRAAVAAVLSELNVGITESEIFLLPGAESAHGAFSRLFSPENDVELCDPGEPFLVTLHRSAGRNVRFLRATADNMFLPPPGERADLIYLSSPNLVTGAVYSAGALSAWIRHAKENGSVIIFDASYTQYALNAPRSIFEIPGARDCAVELFSFDRAFGEPEMKAASLVIPATLVRGGERLHTLFAAEAASVTTPPSFVAQKGAETYLSRPVRPERERLIDGVREVARILSDGLTAAGVPHVGEASGPWVWAQCPAGISAWQFFDLLLEKARVVVTPGSLFGYGGEGYVRLSAYATPEEAREAVAGIA
ncbi:MAG: aminotransferase class I/II-fold pyridoxal phosphate-dependent enzyme, partial [Clostridia bacterium]|nr:aminotransferase class I/II-fold pyridoxal phosphate-dependent enzyme [Clostridia bacterium]